MTQIKPIAGHRATVLELPFIFGGNNFRPCGVAMPEPLLGSPIDMLVQAQAARVAACVGWQGPNALTPPPGPGAR